MPRLLASVAAIAALLLIAAPADASYLYWANGDSQATGSIGRATLDGGDVNNELAKTAYGICGVAADTENVYWTGGNPNGFLGRANLLTGAIENSLAPTASGLPCGVAAGGGFVFFVNNAPPQIGRVNPDGSGLTPSLLNATNAPGISNPQLPTVHGDHLYWVNKEMRTIGRANLDGSNADADFISTGAGCNLLGVAVNDSHVYWGVDYPCMDVGRAEIDGENLDNTFIELSGDHGGLCGVAVHGPHVYWNLYGFSEPQFVGRADLDGQNVDEEFIPNLGKSCGVVVGPDPAPPVTPDTPAQPSTSTPTTSISTPAPKGGFKFKSVSCTKGCGKVLVSLEFEGAGSVVAEQAPPPGRGKRKKGPPKLVKKLTRAVSAGVVTLKLKPTAAGKEKLKEKGKLKVKLRFSFTPSAGTASTLIQQIKAKPPKPKKPKSASKPKR